jgi:sugar phosphate isomerase/epimerase
MNWRSLVLTALLATAIAAPLAAGTVAMAGGSEYAFFPFCIDWHDAKKRTFDEQAAMLKDLGYAGVGHLWLDNVEKRLKSLDAKGLKLFQITMLVNIVPGKEPYDDRKFTQVLSLIKGRGVQFCVLMDGMKPSDPAGDAPAVEILRKMSVEARDSGADLLLYPHANQWLERIEDCVRVADKVDRANVNVMFNLCHWLRVDPGRDYKPLLKRAMPRLHAVSICGADVTMKNPAWTRDYILPLDQGTFDLGAFLKTLKELGYRGPIGLQCYGIGGDAREHLARSMAAWRKLKTTLAE